jgi:glucose/arabinose dehydrogenase/plastocyanin
MLITATAIGAAATVAAGAHEVIVRNFEFDPPAITVQPGDTVRWVWESGFHTATSGSDCTYDEMFFDAPLDSANPQFEWIVPSDAPASIPYFCRPHCAGFDMVGSITVEQPGELLEFNIAIDGFQNVPPIDTPGMGSGTATLDTASNELSWNIEFSDLLGSEVAAHFHGPATHCVEAGVEVALSLGSPKIGSATLTEQQVDDLTAGLWYVQIHSDLHPGGEIRGQVMPTPLADPIPEPIAAGNIHLQLQTLATGMTAPNWATAAPGVDDEIFVTDQAGTLWAVDLETGDQRVFLDASGLLVDLGIFGEDSFDERGLLGVAFHPDYQSNGYLYTYTSQPDTAEPDFSTMPAGFNPNHQTVITEWGVPNPADPEAVVDQKSAREILRIDQPQFNHDGGALNFGPDGMLYIALGDGGDADDEDGGSDPFGEPVVGHGCQGNAQNLESILGKVLRIDPLGNDSANGQYGIPADNPFVNTMDALDEIWAYGFRNPFRFSFDSMTGELWLGDVGQNDIEEVVVVNAGDNHGWNHKEGSFFFVRNGQQPGYVTDRELAVPSDLVDPIAQYDHSEGISVIGGFVYRGSSIEPLQGRYVFGEFAQTFSNDGRLFYLDETNTIHEFPLIDQVGVGLSILGFGQGPDGELYLLGNTTGVPFGDTGVVVKIATIPGDFDANGTVNVDDLLALLSAWGPCMECPEDIDGDGVVGVDDLLELLANFG